MNYVEKQKEQNEKDRT